MSYCIRPDNETLARFSSLSPEERTALLEELSEYFFCKNKGIQNQLEMYAREVNLFAPVTAGNIRDIIRIMENIPPTVSSYMTVKALKKEAPFFPAKNAMLTPIDESKFIGRWAAPDPKDLTPEQKADIQKHKFSTGG